MVTKPTNCDGCGKPFSMDYNDSPEWSRIEIAPNVTVSVCRGRSEAYYGENGHRPSDACVLKARQKKGVCPGCGVEKVRAVGIICDVCLTNIDRGKKVSGDDVTWWSLNHQMAYGPYVSDGRAHGTDDPDDVLRTLTENLLTAVAGERRWVRGWPETGDGQRGGRLNPKTDQYDDIHGGHYFVELTTKQAQALSAFIVELQKVGDLQRRLGHDEGNSLLHQLAGGKVKPDDYEQWSSTKGTKGKKE